MVVILSFWGIGHWWPQALLDFILVSGSATSLDSLSLGANQFVLRSIAGSGSFGETHRRVRTVRTRHCSENPEMLNSPVTVYLGKGIHDLVLVV